MHRAKLGVQVEQKVGKSYPNEVVRGSDDLSSSSSLLLALALPLLPCLLLLLLLLLLKSHIASFGAVSARAMTKFWTRDEPLASNQRDRKLSKLQALQERRRSRSEDARGKVLEESEEKR